jgi:hypothetical protein
VSIERAASARHVDPIVATPDPTKPMIAEATAADAVIEGAHLVEEAGSRMASMACLAGLAFRAAQNCPGAHLLLRGFEFFKAAPSARKAAISSA